MKAGKKLDKILAIFFFFGNGLLAFQTGKVICSLVKKKEQQFFFC